VTAASLIAGSGSARRAELTGVPCGSDVGFAVAITYFASRADSCSCALRT
jgi:hypothetical protein